MQRCAERRGRQSGIIFLTLVLLALFVRLAWLERKSLWMDEAYTLLRASSSIDEITAYAGDATPPLFYLGMHYWVLLGQSEFWLRLPSVLLGALAPGLCYALGRRWFGEWTGIVAGVLLSLAPIHVWSSQEARMYAIASTLGLLSVLSLTAALQRGRWYAWVIWVAATVACFYTHYTTVLLVLVEAVLLFPAARLARAPVRRMGVALLAVAAILLSYFPWVQRVAGDLNVFESMILWYFEPVPRVLAQFGISITAVQVLSTALPMGLLAAVVSGWMGWRLIVEWQRRAFPRKALVAVCLGFMYAAVVVFSAWPSGYGVRRQATIFLPYLMLAIAWVVSTLPPRRIVAAAMTIAVLPVLLVNLALTEWQDWRSTTAFLRQQATPQDLILLTSTFYIYPFGYYYHEAVSWSGIYPSDIPDRLTPLARDKARVWLVMCAPTHDDPQGQIPAWLNAQRGLVHEYAFPGIQVQLYGLPGSGLPQ